MDKLKRILCVALLLLTVVAIWGCEKDDDVAAVPAVYWCLDMEVPAADADGSYTLDFICDGKQVSYRCVDAALAESICLQNVMGLTLEGETITGMRYMYNMPQKLFAWDYCVKSMGGGKVKVNSVQGMNGDERMFEMTEQTKVYLVSPLADVPGEETELMKYDSVTVLTNDNDEAETIFVSGRSYKEDAEAVYCPHCEKDVIWSAWLGDKTVPIGSGHYRLENDIKLQNTFSLGAGKMCLDLNGKRVEQTVAGKRIYTVNGGMEISIMDSVGTGVIRTSTAEPNTSCTCTSGMAIGMYNSEAILNLYGGTLDGAGNKCQWAGIVDVDSGVFNMYGGTILGADPWSTGSGAVCTSGTFNMYDGKIVGGSMVEGPAFSVNPRGGAVVYVVGFFNMYGGTIENAYCEYPGGIVFSRSGTVNLAGGTITGGNSKVSGSGVYIGAGKLILDGNINITGNERDNVCMGDGTTLILGSNLSEDAKVGISMETPGVLGECGLDAIPEGIFSDDPAYKLVVRDGKLILE